MTTYTNAQLATRMLKDLGLVGAEETPTAADLAWGVETIQSELAMLNMKGIAVWNGASDVIPQEYFTLLSRRIGLALVASFGLGDIATATMAMEAAEINLRRINQIGPTGAVLEANYF